MPQPFPAEIVTAVLRHMNDDHLDDNILIARAFGGGPVGEARMTGFDGEGGDWIVADPDGGESALRVPWPGGEITERPQVRQQIVALYDAACARLGVEPRPHA
jgi:hypothetical protein